jgi:hypothetical protein
LPGEASVTETRLRTEILTQNLYNTKQERLTTIFEHSVERKKKKRKENKEIRKTGSELDIRMRRKKRKIRNCR